MPSRGLLCLSNGLVLLPLCDSPLNSRKFICFEVYFIDINIDILIFFDHWSLYDMPFPLLWFILPVSLNVKWVPSKQHIVLWRFLLHFINLCLFVDVFRQLAHKVIICILELKWVLLFLVILLFPLVLIPLFLFSYIPKGYSNMFITTPSWLIYSVLEYIFLSSFIIILCMTIYVYDLCITVNILLL